MKLSNTIHIKNKTFVFLFIGMIIYLTLGVLSPLSAFTLEQEVAIDRSLKLFNRSMTRSWKANLVRINNQDYMKYNALPTTGDSGGKSSIGGRPPGLMPGAYDPGGRPPGQMPAAPISPGDRPPGTLPEGSGGSGGRPPGSQPGVQP